MKYTAKVVRQGCITIVLLFTWLTLLRIQFNRPSLKQATHTQSRDSQNIMRTFRVAYELKIAVLEYMECKQNGTIPSSSIGEWNVSLVEHFDYLFAVHHLRLGSFRPQFEDFDEDISQWDTSSAKTFEGMFYHNIAFNQDIGQWNTSRVTDMANMFGKTQRFNQDLSRWDTRNVISMTGMFEDAISFDQDVSTWQTDKVTSMVNMFAGATRFNQDISRWNTSSVIYFGAMFQNATLFNQDLSSWDVQKVNGHSRFRGFTSMFDNALSFQQNLCSWRDQINLSRQLESWKPLRQMFVGTACPSQSEPPFSFCHPCLRRNELSEYIG